jgi:deazaflavin-dependent oxidoreductase (nitroreductase family)
MPIPKYIAFINKHVTNRFFFLFAKWLPPFAIVNHRGRRSGRRYRTPILAFPTETGFVFALTYGRDVDWVRNLMAADSGRLEYKGSEVPIHMIRFAKYDDVLELFPQLVRLPLGLISVEDCLLVEVDTR